MLFRDRTEAGRRLAPRLMHLRGNDPVVVGLGQGAMLVAFEVAKVLRAPLGILTEDTVRDTLPTPSELSAAKERGEPPVERRGRRRDPASVPLTGRTAVLVGDGVQSEAMIRAACRLVRTAGAARVVIAVPVGGADLITSLAPVADELICLYPPEPLRTIRQSYASFEVISDEDVRDVLMKAREYLAGRPPHIDLTVREIDVTVHTSDAVLPGRLTVPAAARMTVVFAHGSGSSRHSPRNLLVASVLNRAGLGTLTFDLLTGAEELDRTKVFDIPVLARRLVETIAWLRKAGLGPDRIALFGASTGAAAALWAASEPGSEIRAVVSRGGRPDLALPRLGAVSAPTLLIVGGRDHDVLALNRKALGHLGGESRLVVVAGATHLFGEPGTLEEAAELARDWFVDHLAPTDAGRAPRHRSMP